MNEVPNVRLISTSAMPIGSGQSDKNDQLSSFFIDICTGSPWLLSIDMARLSYFPSTRSAILTWGR